MKKEKSVEEFYDSLSIVYHLVDKNWDESIERQAKIIDELIQEKSRLISHSMQ